AGVVLSDGAAGGLLLGLVVAGEVGTDGGPAHAVVGGFEEHFGTVIDDAGIVGRERDRSGPLKAVDEIGGAVTHGIQRPRGDLLRLAGRLVETGDESVVGAGIDDVGIAGIGNDEAAFAAADVKPIALGDGAVVAAAGDGDGGVVLLRAVDVVEELIFGGDGIEMRGGLVVLGRPGFAAVGGDGGAAVIAFDHAGGIFGIDPEAVAIAMGRANRLEGLAGIGGAVHASVEDVHRVGVLGIREDVREIPGALREAVVVGQLVPGVAAVVRAVQAAGFGFDESIDAARAARSGRDSDAAVRTFGKAVAFEFFPGCAAVRGLIERASRTAAVEPPGCAHRLPHGGVENVRVGGIERDIDGAGLVVHIDDLLPGLAAVGGAEEAAFGVRAPGVAEGRDEDDVGIARVHDDAGDVARVVEADVRPGLTGVHGFIHPVAEGDVAANAGFAGADVDDVGIGRRHGNAADGRDRLLIEERNPGDAGVGGFPDAAGDRAEIIRVGIAGNAGDREDATATEWSDETPFHFLERVLVESLRGKQGREEECEKR